MANKEKDKPKFLIPFGNKDWTPVYPLDEEKDLKINYSQEYALMADLEDLGYKVDKKNNKYTITKLK